AAADREDPGPESARADVADQRDPGALGHHQIGDHEVEALPGQRLECDLAVFGLDHVMTAEHAADRGTDHGVAIDDENPRHSAPNRRGTCSALSTPSHSAATCEGGP